MSDLNGSSLFRLLKESVEENIKQKITNEEFTRALVDLGKYRKEELLSIVKGTITSSMFDQHQESPIKVLSPEKSDWIIQQIPPDQLTEAWRLVNRCSTPGYMAAYIIFGLLIYWIVAAVGEWIYGFIPLSVMIAGGAGHVFIARYYRDIVFLPDKVLRFNYKGQLVNEIAKTDILRVILYIYTPRENEFEGAFKIEFILQFNSKSPRLSASWTMWSLKRFFKLSIHDWLRGAKQIIEYIRIHWGMPVELSNTSPNLGFIMHRSQSGQ